MMNASQSTSLIIKAVVLLLLICVHQQTQFICNAFTTTPVVVTSTPTAFSHIQQLRSSDNTIATAVSDIYVSRMTTTTLFSSFYGKFEDFDLNEDDEDEDEDEDDEDEEDDDDDDDDDDEYEKMDDRSIADFKSKMSNLFDATKAEGVEGGESRDNDDSGEGSIGSVEELIEFARKQQQQGESTGSGTDDDDEDKETIVEDWAKPIEGTPIRPGTVLIANPRMFCEDGDFGDMDSDDNESTGGKDFFGLGLSSKPAPSLLAKFGLTQPPPRHLGADRQADLLPVVIVVSTDGGQIQGVLLNRRTGYLLGDLEQPADDGSSDDNNDNNDMAPILEKFCIQPLWFGGIDSLSVGLDMLHLCPTVNDAQQITDDGMYWGGDPTQAQDAMEDPSLDRIYSGFDFKFFVQSTIWSSGVLQGEVDDKIWFQANVSNNVLFKSRDRMGTKKAKPLWTEILDLMGNEYSDITKSFYATE
jgi:hypothetical protein